MNFKEDTTIKYSFINNLPETGCTDEFQISINLNTNPGIESIIGNFYRFVLRLGANKEVVDQFISFPDHENEEYDDEEKNNSTTLTELLTSKSKETIEKNIKDEEKKSLFIEKLSQDAPFLENVFKIYLSSLLEDSE